MAEAVFEPALVLGTAQLGMAYGIANRKGALGDEAARRLIQRARALGVTCFDTARAYGLSEARLGRALFGDPEARIVTKLAPLDHLPADCPADLVAQAVRQSIEQSADALCRGRLDVVLLHRARHLRTWHDAAWETMCALKSEGRIARLGVSVQDTDELRLALSYRTVDHIQLPINLLDWRWRDQALRERLDMRCDVTVHARSVLLQGLLNAENACFWPAIEGINAKRFIETLGALAEMLGRETITDLAIAYVRAQPFVHGIVIGAESDAQLQANMRLCQKAPLDPDEVSFLERFLPNAPETLLNPALWPRREAA